MLNSNLKGTLLALLSGLCYAPVGYFGVELIANGMSISNMLFWRFLIASIFMVFICWNEISPKLFNFKKQFFILALSHIGASYFYFKASYYIGTGLAIVIFFFFPIVIVLFNYFFFKKNISKNYISLFFIILIGLGLTIRVEHFAYDLRGVLYGIIAAVFYALYIVYSKHTLKELSPKVSAFFVCVGSSIFLLIYVLLKKELIVPHNAIIWILEIGNGLIATAFSIYLFLEAMKYISSEKASILSVLEPVFVNIFAVILLNEQFTKLQIAGIVIILLSVIIVRKEE